MNHPAPSFPVQLAPCTPVRGTSSHPGLRVAITASASNVRSFKLLSH